MVPVLARVARRYQELDDIVTFELEVPGWQGFAPGQFNMLGVFGVGEVPISISGPVSDPERIVHTVRAVGPVSRTLADLAEGATLSLRGPYGRPWPVERARGRDVVVMAGGLGLAPVRPILYELIENRAAYGKVTLLYGARGPREILFPGDLSDWRARLDFGTEVTVDRATADWRGHVGVVTSLIPAADFDPTKTVAFVCGPEVMMRFSAHALTDRGVAASEIFLSMERNMQCAIGLCGHCQLGPVFVCRDGPVFDWARLRPLMAVKEL
jgi:NAD(P)H-flavin reductase